MHRFLKPLVFTLCQKCGKEVLPHTVCQNCGYYKGREMINIFKKLNKKEKKKREKEISEKEKQEKTLNMKELSKK